MKNQAEQLKVKFGSALATEIQGNEVISIPGLKGRTAKEISTRNLASIIQARVEEIIEHVYYEIQVSGYEKKLIGGIVLTGGGSQLRHLVQLTEYITGLDARVGLPTEHLAIHTKDQTLQTIGHPMYATAIGLVMKGFQDVRFLEQPLDEPVAAAMGPRDPHNGGNKRIGVKLRDFWQRSLGWWFEDVDATEEFSER
jgi:cell division protein FtsA